MRRFFLFVIVAGIVAFGLLTWWTKYRPADSTAGPARAVANTHVLENPVADLPANLASMRPDVAAIAAWLDDRVLTRFDTAGPATIQCDEGFGPRALLVADARVLDVAPSQGAQREARVELVSVGRASVVSQGCDVSSVAVADSVRTDTIRMYVERTGNTWEVQKNETFQPEFDNAPLAAPGDFYGKSNANWSALYGRVDSVRLARGTYAARLRVAGPGHRGGPAVPYPLDNGGCPAVSSVPPGADGRPEFAYVHPTEYTPSEISGPWYRVYETTKAPGRSCVAPVSMKSGYFATQVTCSRPGSTPVRMYWPQPDGMPRDALLLVRNVPGLQPGLAPASFSVQAIDAWRGGVMIYGDSSEVLRIVETGPEQGERASGYRLSALYKGRRIPLMWSDAERPETWGVVWVGLLNDDDVPDMVVRTAGERASSQSGVYTEYGFTLYLSSPTDARGWIPGTRTVLADC